MTQQTSLMRAVVDSALRGVAPQRSTWPSIPIDAWAQMAGQSWPYGFGRPLYLDREEIDGSFPALVESAYKANGVVFAVELARLMLFVQARFVFRRWIDGEPQKPFTSPALDLLNVKPWEGGTTSDLLMRLLQSGDFGGTGFVVRRDYRTGPELRVPRPDWMTILLGSEIDPAADSRSIDATIVGYLYHPGGRYSGEDPVPLLPAQVAHFIPVADPLFRFRGIPWLQPVVRNVQAYKAASDFKLAFYTNGATPQIVVTLGEKANDPERFRKWIELFEQEHSGSSNAYRTLYLAAGASAEVVGSNLQQLDLRNTTDIDELSIANAGGVPATVVGLSEGLQGSSLNAGNFGQSMRRFANLTIRPLWANASGSLARIIDVPNGAELWYADKHIPALQEDVKDASLVLGQNATAMRTLVDGGFGPDAVVDYIVTGDPSRLKGQHTGLLPVQLQTPGSSNSGNGQAPPANGTPAEGEASARIVGAIRCTGCGRLLLKRTRPGGAFEMKCRDCGALVAG